METNFKKIEDLVISEDLKQSDKYYLCVIMPAYNEGMHIRENLLNASQIISGFVHNYKIIVVDDGSSDNTREEIISASEKDSKISYKLLP